MTHVEELLQAGIRRVGSPKSGFRWVGAPRRQLDRLYELKIPPAWTQVRVSRDPAAKVQAIGKDKAGRWQYRYSDEAVRLREHKKYRKLIAFGKALPALRKEIDRALALPGLPREKVLAVILRILSTCFMRPGSEVYAKENGSFGIVTLRNRHVRVHGDTVEFDFIGKAGKRQLRALKDRRVARAVSGLKKVPGKELFQFRDEAGAVHKVTRQMLNQHIKQVMGSSFSAKDFRTWAGTMICANVLARMAAASVEGVTDRRKVLTAAVKETSEQLGNTPAVCKSSYIWPSILSSYYKGTTLAPYFKSAEELIIAAGAVRTRSEKALLDLLAHGANATPIALAKKQARRRRELEKMTRAAKTATRAQRRLSRAFALR